MVSTNLPTNQYRLPLSIVRVTGVDAVQIVNNLATSDLKPLHVGDCIEAFITEVRGRTLGHVTIRRDADGLTLVGPVGQSEAIASHIDRYTIREDAVTQIADKQFTALVQGPSTPRVDSISNLTTDWLGNDTTVTLDQRDTLEATDDSTIFHDARIHAGFAWWGIDFDSKNLPQEVNRDSIAISFTKGCYLGQETVARLDALGQVQKKLVRLAIADGGVRPGDKVIVDDKPLARITSVTSDGTLAFAMVRRQWFDPGTDAKGFIEKAPFAATVLA